MEEQIVTGIVKVQIKDVYGKETIYPANEAGYHFADIAGTKTLTSETIQKIKNLGYRVEVLQAVTVL